MTEDEIKYFCMKYDIENYKINPDMSIDVDGGVNISEYSFTEIPIKFNKVADYFECSRNKLTSLKGCPTYVGGYFSCNNNNLTTLEGCPEYTGSGFYCFNNTLTTMNGLPMNFYVGDEFQCEANEITEAKEYGKLFFGTINGYIRTDDYSLNGFLNDNKNPPKKDLPRLLSELRKIIL